MTTSITHVYSLTFFQKNAWKGGKGGEKRERERERRERGRERREEGRRKGGNKILRMLCNQSIFSGHMETHIYTKNIYVCVCGEGERET